MSSAFFGDPTPTIVAGGTYITVYLVPVFDGQLTVFDVAAHEARGRWLPWDVLEWGGNPYECASALADQWCAVGLTDLSLVDIMSVAGDRGAWELAIVFRAELSEPARGDDVRVPHRFARGEFDAIGSFDPVDLERWTGRRTAGEHPEPGGGQRPGLLF